VSPEDLALTAAALMREAHVDQLPVVNADGHPVGLIDVQDLLAARLDLGADPRAGERLAAAQVQGTHRVRISLSRGERPPSRLQDRLRRQRALAEHRQNRTMPGGPSMVGRSASTVGTPGRTRSMAPVAVAMG
jgi:CBS domain-containing protein